MCVKIVRVCAYLCVCVCVCLCVCVCVCVYVCVRVFVFVNVYIGARVCVTITEDKSVDVVTVVVDDPWCLVPYIP
jgi:hypothetical protein